MERETVAMNRYDAREAVFTLLFETEFKQDEAREAIYALALSQREIEDDPYVRDVYFGVCEHVAEIDDLISRHSKGWKVSRISRVSRSLLRLCIYEMLYRDEIPESVSINEAVELCKKYDEEKARPFLNGVLNGVKNEIAERPNA